MEPKEDLEQDQALAKVGGVVAILVIILLVGIFVWHEWTKKRESEVVLHSGYTYTGPTPTGGAAQPPAPAGAVFTAPEGAPWKTVKGEIYEYSFLAPQSLELVRFPDDPYDIWAISWNNLTPQSNVLIGVDDLSKNETFKEYVSQPKIAYVENWWKQFGLSGVKSITPFTNSAGMKGYKAKFTIGENPAPTDDVFFEVPKKPNLVIHLSNGVLDPAVFDKLVDSVSWGENVATTSAE